MATASSAQGELRSSRRDGTGTLVLLARRAFADGRVRTIAFAYLFAVYAYIQATGYANLYPTVKSRLAFARSFAGNSALRLFYGEPHNLLTVGGYSAWRVGGTLTILAAVWGVLAAVRALRAEEDAGRAELVLASGVSRREVHLSALLAIFAGAVLLWLAAWLGLLAGGLDAGGSAYLALTIVSVIAPFVGIGALASQLAPRKRVASMIGNGVVAAALALRAVADTSAGAGWLRWLTPLGWGEQLRPYSGAQPLALLAPLALGAALLVWAARIAQRRDIGSALLPARDSAPAHLRLLSSPTAQALRFERGAMLVWVAVAGVFAYILGAVSNSVKSAGISRQLNREVSRVGAGSIITPKGYLGFCFLLFVLAVSLFACSQIAAARSEESAKQLETLLALPVGRRRWLFGRLCLTAAAAAVISITSGLLAGVGAVSQGVSISLGTMLLAGVNCLPVTLLTLAVGALLYAILPRPSVAIAYTLVSIAFLWDLVGSLVQAPHWLLEATPFAHVALVPAAPFRTGAALLMLALAAVLVPLALALFARRDLVE
ncbi:MAG: polyketide antibiotic transporter [Solirubrobacteraceae bacterium]